MNRLLDLLRASTGERNTRNALGRWRQAVSRDVDALGANVSQIVWRPGVPTTSQHVATWLEVVALADAAPGLVCVVVDTSVAPAIIPSGFYDLDGRVGFCSIDADWSFSGPPTLLSLVDGAQLENPRFFENITVETNQTTAPAFIIGNFGSLSFNLGASLNNLGTVPVISVLPGVANALRFQGQSSINGTTPLVDLGASGILAVQGLQSPNLVSDAWSGGPGSFIIYLNDGTWEPPPLSAFFGTYVLDARLPNADRAKPAQGPTGDRPTGSEPFGPLTGQMYFDTDLGRPVWWTGTTWVDATGAPA